MTEGYKMLLLKKAACSQNAGVKGREKAWQKIGTQAERITTQEFLINFTKNAAD